MEGTGFPLTDAFSKVLIKSESRAFETYIRQGSNFFEKLSGGDFSLRNYLSPSVRSRLLL
jgi:hypothetical protein